MPRLRGSSSTNPIAWTPSAGLSCSSRTTIWPPEPAPTISDLRVLRSRAAFSGRSIQSRVTIRAPARRPVVRMKSRIDDRARQVVVERLERR